MATQLLERGARRRNVSPLIGVLRRLDYLMLATTFALTLIGLVMIYSATRSSYPDEPTYYLKRQAIYAVMGVVIMVAVMVIDYRRIRDWAWVIYGLVILALLAVRAVGKPLATGGTREISFGPLTVQPSEFAVLAVIIVVARYVQLHEESLRIGAIAKLLGFAAVPMALVYLQPDLGTTLIIAVIVLTLLVLSGVRARLLALLVVIGVGGFLLGKQLHVLQGYQIGRLTAFLHQSATCPPTNDNSCYQLQNSKIAIGAGGLTGTGLFNGAVTNNGYVPEEYADFIFSAIGEQLGFLGCLVVVGLYGLLAFRFIRAMQLARDSFGRLVAGGTLVFIAFSAFQNIGMTIGIMPITGIPLPLISFGGSALFATYAAIGLVVNIELRRGGLR